MTSDGDNRRSLESGANVRFGWKVDTWWELAAPRIQPSKRVVWNTVSDAEIFRADVEAKRESIPIDGEVAIIGVPPAIVWGTLAIWHSPVGR